MILTYQEKVSYSLWSRVAATHCIYSVWKVVSKFVFIEVTEIYSQFFHDRGPYQIETSPLICSTN